VIIDKDASDTIYTATNGSPLLIGFSAEEDEILVVSERIAFEKHVSCFFPSNDHEVFELKVTEIKELKERIKDRLIHITEPQKVELAPPSEFKNWYNYEIRQQGTIEFVPDFDRVQALKFGDYLSMIACGSSYYAAMASEYFFKKLHCFKKIQIVDPVELDPNDITENETVVLISQSGETKDLISIVGDCKRKENVKTIGIINV
jgi:glucosamine--fructose-6-phosphate aminotransferase (isomerizing)